MAAKPENTFRASVHKHVRAVIYHMKTNNPYLAGVPDDWYSGTGDDLWVEYKFVVIPKRADTVIDINTLPSPLQRDWLIGRHIEGRNVAVIVGCKEGGVIFPGRSWQTELTAHEFRQRLLPREEIARWIENRTGVKSYGDK